MREVTILDFKTMLDNNLAIKMVYFLSNLMSTGVKIAVIRQDVYMKKSGKINKSAMFHVKHFDLDIAIKMMKNKELTERQSAYYEVLRDLDLIIREN